jgi:N-acetylglucosaminyl-diphospho-decaprenol L-rhamnosyltransferase
VEVRVSKESSVELSIIFVNWNSFCQLRGSLRSVFATVVGVEYEVIVVDNASLADDATDVEAEFCGVKLIASKKNLGFAGANNLGVEHSRGQYLLFLNPDTLVIGNAIADMLGAMKAVGGAGIVGCKLLNSDGSVQTSCVQRFPTIWNQLLDVEYLRRRWPNWKLWGIAPLFNAGLQPVEVEVVSGACLLIDRDSFDQAGGFSSEYFMYAEDVDLCYQIRKLGRKAYYTNSASVFHHGGGTSRERCGKAWVAIMQRQAILKFYRRTRGSAYAEMFRLAMACNAMLRLILLAIMLPFRKRAADERVLCSTPEKWFGILKWALGLDRRASRLRQGA